MPVSLDLAALARSLRLPPYALRIVDLSGLAPKAREKVYGSALEYWADRVLPPPPVLPAVPAPLRRRLLELDAEMWAELRARAAWEGIAPAAMILAALADGLAAWSRDPRFTV